MRRRLKLAAVGGALLLFSAGLFVSLGLVPIKASSGHWAITEWFLHFAMARSVSTHSTGITPPDLKQRRLILMGASHYEAGCRFCHGAPGARMPEVLQHATPHPPKLADAAERYDAAELFYIVRHGIKFTGMPAWPAENRDDEVWAVTAFLKVLPALDAEGYQALVFGDTAPGTPEQAAPSVVIERCARCHGVGGAGREDAFPVLAQQTQSYLKSSLRAYATGSRHSGIMQPIATELLAAEIEAATRWYAAQPRPPRSPARPIHRAGESIALSGIAARKVPACSDCHGPAPHPLNPGYPTLDGQPAAYLRQQIELFAAGTRGGTKYQNLMQTIDVHSLKEAEIHAVARYYAERK
jgi:cytochrome c553